MRWCLKSPASRLFTHPFVQAQIKENSKAPRHWPLWGESTGDRWIPLTKGQWHSKVSIWWRHHDWWHYRQADIYLLTQVSPNIDEARALHEHSSSLMKKIVATSSQIADSMIPLAIDAVDLGVRFEICIIVYYYYHYHYHYHHYHYYHYHYYHYYHYYYYYYIIIIIITIIITLSLLLSSLLLLLLLLISDHLQSALLLKLDLSPLLNYEGNVSIFVGLLLCVCLSVSNIVEKTDEQIFMKFSGW